MVQQPEAELVKRAVECKGKIADREEKIAREQEYLDREKNELARVAQQLTDQGVSGHFLVGGKMYLVGKGALTEVPVVMCDK
jgi:hypothetical protein